MVAGRENSAPSWRERSGALDVESLLERVLGGMLSHPSPRGPGMRKQSGDAVALKFEPDRVLYDPDEDVVRFFANEGPVLIRWAISKAALAELEHHSMADPDAMMDAYRRNRELIWHIAERKYRAHRYETGRVVVRLQDLAA